MEQAIANLKLLLTTKALWQVQILSILEKLWMRCGLIM